MKIWLYAFGIVALLSMSASGHEPINYQKQVRQFPDNKSWQKDFTYEVNEYCYDGVVYVRMSDVRSGRFAISSAKFDRNTKQVVTCK